ncbi:hypothetical protein P3G55_14180 [Leptospira sp. 96542]|nr:hypothetical protein [Leptospira sp. 96542]
MNTSIFFQRTPKVILIFKVFVIILLFSTSLTQIYAEDFSDLEETRVKVYGSEKDKKYKLDGFFVEWENWPRENPTHNHFHLFWFANTTNYPKYKKDQIFPFFSSIESKVDSRKSNNILLLYSSNVDRRGNESTSFFPFYFSGKSTNGSSYLGIFPLFYKSYLQENNITESTLIFPGFYHYNSKNQDSTEVITNSVSLFHYHSAKKDKTNKTITTWFPILPLYFQSEDDISVHSNYFWFIDSNTNKPTNTMDRFWFFPFVFWKKDNYTTLFPIFFAGNDSKNNSYSVIPLLYFNETNNKRSHTNLFLIYDQEKNEEGSLERKWIAPIYFYKKYSYNYIIPFYFENTAKETNSDKKNITYHSWFSILPPMYRSYSEEHSTFYLLNFYTNTSRTGTTEEKTINFFPFYFSSNNNLNESQTIIPFFYYNETDQKYNSHTNVLLFWDQNIDQKKERERLWIFPFYFSKKDSYHYILPFYFSSVSDKKDEGEITWGPFYYSEKSETSQNKYVLLYYHSIEKTKYTASSRTNILPFAYFWNTSSTSITNGKIKNENGFFIFPFFYQNNNNSEEIYSNLLGFISWTKDKDKKLIQNTIFPIRFYEKNSHSVWFPLSFQFGETEEKAERGNRWGLFFYSSWSPEEEKHWVVNYYSNKDIKKDQYSKTFFPFYHSWKGEKSNGTLLLPLYIDADFADEKEKDKYNNFSLNILGIASETQKGIFRPNVSVDAGKKSEYYYLDTDVSWLYYAFRLSNRTSTKLIEDIFPNGKKYLIDSRLETSVGSEKKPRIESKRSFTREDSYNFFGLNLLFGVFGYEAADSKRHIRLLPLAWFTYDTEVDENIYAGPLPLPFIWYSSAALKYRIIFPIYGYQKSEDAERNSYGLFVFLNEKIRENNVQETTVLWPLVNWYRSDTNSGARVLPFYWQKTKIENQIISDSTFIPIGLSYFNTFTTEKNLELKTWITPLLIRTDTEIENGYKSQTFPPIPIFYWSKEKTSSKEESRFLSPLYMQFSSNETTGGKKDISNFWMIPIVGFESRTNGNYWLNYFILFNKTKSDETDSLSILPYYSEFDKKNKSNFSSLFFLMQYESDVQKTSYRFFPFFQFSSLKQKPKNEFTHRNWFFPIFLTTKSAYYDGNKNLQNSNSFFSLIYTSISNHEADISLIPMLYYSEDSFDESFRSYLLIANRSIKENSKSYNFFPLFHSSVSTEKNENIKTNWLFPLYYIFSKTASQTNTEESLTIIPPLFYFSKFDDKAKYRNFLFLFSSKENSEYNSYSAFPFFYTEFGKIDQDLNITNKDWVFPIYSRKTIQDTEGKKVASDFFSIFYISKLEYSKDEQIIRSKRSIPPFLYFSENKGDSSKWSLFFLIQSQSDSENRGLNILPLFHTSNHRSKNTKESRNWLFPFYYYDSSARENSLIESDKNVKKNTDLLSSSEKESKEFDQVQFISPLFFYSSKLLPTKNNDYRRTFFFPIFPLFYRETSLKLAHTNLFYLFDRKVKDDNLNRFYLFPFYYSNENPKDKKSVSYYHLIPIYFSGLNENEYTAFILGLYLDMNEVNNYKNFLYLVEQESGKKTGSNEFNLFFRSFHYFSDPSALNIRLLYGIGEMSLYQKRSQMNLIWLGYKNSEETFNLNLMPLYYTDKSKASSVQWITPLLYYAEKTKQKKIEHSALGLLYYNSENLETKESLENVLFGIIYYKTVKPKERGYTGRGSFWGALWEYNTEEDTNYSKFSILKILYSRRQDDEGVRHRILFFEF